MNDTIGLRSVSSRPRTASNEVPYIGTDRQSGVYARVMRQLDTIRVKLGAANRFLDVRKRRIKTLNGHSGVVEVMEQAPAAAWRSSKWRATTGILRGPSHDQFGLCP